MTERPSEFDLIRTYFAPLSALEKGAFNLTDDAAIIEPAKGQSLVVTTDALVGGVHFLTDDQPEDIAAKLLRVSLSDLAAMGATPAYYNLAIAVPPDLTATWFKAFCQSLAADQKEFGITLIGGDTVSTEGPLTLSLTAMGYVETDKGLRRSGAKIGDDIWVSGSIGDGALGLQAAMGTLSGLDKQDEDYLLSRYRQPCPRTKLGPNLIEFAHAAIDISDGLIADLGHICETSHVGADIQINAIPLSEVAKKRVEQSPGLIDLVLGGGDDYELLFTTNVSFSAISPSIALSSDTILTKIGTITEGPSIRLFDFKGEEYALTKKGYSHF